MDGTVRIASVTGVDVELRVAGPGGRSYAFIIDWHIRALLAFAWVVLAGAVATADGASTAVMAYAVYLPGAAVYFLYHPLIETFTGGRTPGKRIAGVRLLKTDGGVPGIGALLIRNVFRLVDSLPVFYCIGLATTMMTKNCVRIGDIAAGTLLVYDDPEGIDSLDGLTAVSVGRLGLQQAEIARDLLRRWDELAPAVRRSLARQLLAKSGITPAIEGEGASPAAFTAEGDLTSPVESAAASAAESAAPGDMPVSLAARAAHTAQDDARLRSTLQSALR